MLSGISTASAIVLASPLSSCSSRIRWIDLLVGDFIFTHSGNVSPNSVETSNVVTTLP
jgi:hypothetical protein